MLSSLKSNSLRICITCVTFANPYPNKDRIALDYCLKSCQYHCLCFWANLLAGSEARRLDLIHILTPAWRSKGMMLQHLFVSVTKGLIHQLFFRTNLCLIPTYAVFNVTNVYSYLGFRNRIYALVHSIESRHVCAKQVVLPF